MIQRIQTVLLFAAAVLNLAVLGVPLWTMKNGDAEAVFTGLHIDKTGPEAAVLGLGDNSFVLAHFLLILLASGFAVFTIFGYQNRQRQIRYTYISRALFCIQIMVAVLFISQKMGGIISLNEEFPGTAEIGFFFPLASVLLVWFAATRIRKDEELVKSADRFR